MGNETLQARTHAPDCGNCGVVRLVRRVSPAARARCRRRVARRWQAIAGCLYRVGALGSAAFEIRNRAREALAAGVIATIALGGLSACSFDTAPGIPPRELGAVRPVTDAGVHLVDDAGAGAVVPPGHVGPYVAQIQHDGHIYVVLDGGVYELQRDDAGAPALVAVDAGAELEPDAGNASSSPPDAGALEPDAGGAPPGRKICGQCFDGTFKCPSSTNSTGFACRSWPPCYCTDGGT